MRIRTNDQAVCDRCRRQEFSGKTIMSVTVGVATATLQFDADLAIAVHHGFEYRDGRRRVAVRNRFPDSAAWLFPVLNGVLESVSLSEDHGLILELGGDRSLTILAAGDGYESYELRSKAGELPVY
jgi:hypothetical protein